MDILKLLEEQFPTARPGFIKVLTEALELHARKNNDYNGGNTTSVQLYNDAQPETNKEFEMIAKFCDIRRKYGRLYNAIAIKREMKVDEKLEDTAIDLLVYSALFLEFIKGEK